MNLPASPRTCHAFAEGQRVCIYSPRDVNHGHEGVVRPQAPAQGGNVGVSIDGWPCLYQPWQLRAVQED